MASEVPENWRNMGISILVSKQPATDSEAAQLPKGPSWTITSKIGCERVQQRPVWENNRCRHS